MDVVLLSLCHIHCEVGWLLDVTIKFVMFWETLHGLLEILGCDLFKSWWYVAVMLMVLVLLMIWCAWDVAASR